MEAIHEFQSDKELTRTLFNNFGTLLVFTFYAQWNKPSVQLRNNLSSTIPLFGQFSNVKYFALAAEKCPETFKKFGIEYTPTVLFTQTDKKVIRKFQSQDVGIIFDALAQESEAHKANFQQQKRIWHPKIKSILSQSPVIVFIKGTPTNPKCGFTQTLLNLLHQQGVEFTFYDIIEDEYMRYWLRNYSGWPSYPQVYSQGQLIGGLDVCKDLVAKGVFLDKIPLNSRSKSVEQKFEDLRKQYKLLVLTDGFSFENKEAQAFINKVRESYNNQDPTIYNLGLDEKLKKYVMQKNGNNLPLLFVEGELVKL